MSYNKIAIGFIYNLIFFLSIHYIIFAGDTVAKSIRFESAIVLSRQDSLNSIESLKNGIDKLLNNKLINNCNYAIAIYSLNQKKYLYAKNIKTLLTPASTMKLITTYTAFINLGADYILHTNLYTDGSQTNDSTLTGNLYLIGSGDALFSSDDLDKIVNMFKKSGVKNITGKIYSDGSFFDSVTDRLIYSGDNERVENLQPITALSIDRNLLTVNVFGSSSGISASVQLVPNTSAITLRNSSLVGKARKKKPYNLNEIDTTIYFNNSCLQPLSGGDINLFAIKRSHKSKKTLSLNYTEHGKIQYLSISGTILPNQSFSYQIHQKKPHLIAAGTLKNKLRENSITTDGNIDECYLFNNGSISKLNTIAQFDRELPELIAVANKHSDNYVAETIFKLIGAYNGNHKNNSSKSRYVIKGLLNSIGIDTNNFQINDGSGLSRRNKITAESLIKILISLFYHKDFSKFDSTLSISGVDGTLRKRLIGTKAEGNLRAKTGTLRNVSALAGYVNTLDDEKLAFAFIFNGPNPPAYKSIEDEIGKLLAQFFYYHFEN